MFSRAVDSLETLNKEIQSLGCTAIYDAQNGIDGASALLQGSTACSIRQYPKRCPDPYGKLKTYTTNIESASSIIVSQKAANSTLNKAMTSLTYIVGVLLMLASCYLTGKAVEESENKEGIKAASGDADSVSSRSARSVIRRVALGVTKTASRLKERVQNFAEATDVAETEKGKDEFKDENVSVKSERAEEASQTPLVAHDEASVHEAAVAHDEASVHEASETPYVAPVEDPTQEETNPAPSDGRPPMDKKYKRPRLAKLSKKLFGCRQQSDRSDTLKTI
jgi:hypothetical protein